MIKKLLLPLMLTGLLTFSGCSMSDEARNKRLIMADVVSLDDHWNAASKHTEYDCKVKFDNYVSDIEVGYNLYGCLKSGDKLQILVYDMYHDNQFVGISVKSIN